MFSWNPLKFTKTTGKFKTFGKYLHFTSEHHGIDTKHYIIAYRNHQISNSVDIWFHFMARNIWLQTEYRFIEQLQHRHDTGRLQNELYLCRTRLFIHFMEWRFFFFDIHRTLWTVQYAVRVQIGRIQYFQWRQVRCRIPSPFTPSDWYHTIYIIRFIPYNLYSFAAGKLTLLESSSSKNYFEKPIDYDDNTDTAGLHLIANALRLNNKKYTDYDPSSTSANATTDPEDYNLLFNYDYFQMYYRAGQPGYVNRSDGTSESKYSAIVTMDVDDVEECAMYCTRNRGIIDDDLGTRCVSFNYHTLSICR